MIFFVVLACISMFISIVLFSSAKHDEQILKEEQDNEAKEVILQDYVKKDDLKDLLQKSDNDPYIFMYKIKELLK